MIHRIAPLAVILAVLGTSVSAGLADARVLRSEDGSGTPSRTARGHTFRPYTLVRISAPTNVAKRPGGPTMGTLSGSTPLGSASWLWAVGRSIGGAWLQVVLPWRPNGRTGWIRRPAHRMATSISIQVDLSERRLALDRRGRTMAAFPAGVGAAQSPTPQGRFSVTDLVLTGDPQGPFGWFALGLSGHQPTLPPGWSGGDQLAIHGTNNPTSIGAAVSAGCVHVSSHALATLRRWAVLGTPVLVRP
jgi:L,D-transpeptidase-like protein